MVYRTRGKNAVTALDDLHLRVDEGELVTLVGPSGCGKSTVLKLVSGLLAPTAGQVRIHGQAVTGPRREMGFVFQTPVLLPWRTVRDNVLLPIEMLGLPVREHAARADELLEKVGLDGFQKSHSWELSGGMQQRVGICRALVHNPEILLMDEPFAALDAMTRETIGLELLRIWEERRQTVLFVTHSIPEAVLLADKVVVMTARPGRIASVIPIDLPRPRTVEMEYDGRFKEAALEIRALIDRAGPAPRRSDAGQGPIVALPGTGPAERPNGSASAGAAFGGGAGEVGRWVAPLVSLILILALWQAAVIFLRLPRFVLPPPAAVLAALASAFPTLLFDTWITLRETVAGFLLSILVAVPLAILITSSAPLRNGIYPFLLLGQSVPKQAIAPLLLLWLGYGEFPRIVLAFLTAFFPIVVNTAIGLQMTPPEMQDLGRLLSASRRRVFFKVTFPCAMPYFFAGLKVAIGLAVIGAVIGEFIGGDTGLGQRILVASGNQRTDLAFAAILMLSLLGIALFGLVALAEKLLCPWYDKG